MISVRKAKRLGKVYTPVFVWEENEFIFATLKDMFESEEEAKNNYINVGMDIMARTGAGYTGKAHEVPVIGGAPGIALDHPDGRFVFIAGPLYEQALDSTVDDVEHDMARFMLEAGFEIED